MTILLLRYSMSSRPFPSCGENWTRAGCPLEAVAGTERARPHYGREFQVIPYIPSRPPAAGLRNTAKVIKGDSRLSYPLGLIDSKTVCGPPGRSKPGRDIDLQIISSEKISSSRIPYSWSMWSRVSRLQMALSVLLSKAESKVAGIIASKIRSVVSWWPGYWLWDAALRTISRVPRSSISESCFSLAAFCALTTPKFCCRASHPWLT